MTDKKPEFASDDKITEFIKTIIGFYPGLKFDWKTNGKSYGHLIKKRNMTDSQLDDAVDMIEETKGDYFPKPWVFTDTFKKIKFRDRPIVTYEESTEEFFRNEIEKYKSLLGMTRDGHDIIKSNIAAYEKALRELKGE